MKRQCKAKSKQSGERCKRAPVAGMEVCAIHGGKTPSGLALPQTKHGRYSKHLAAAGGINDAYLGHREAANATQLLDEIALLRARISQSAEQLSSVDWGQLWQGVQEAVESLVEEMTPEQRDSLESQLDALRAAINEGINASAAQQNNAESWNSIETTARTIGRLVRVEQTREARMQETMTAREAAIFRSVVEANLVEALEGNCDDELKKRVLGAFTFGIRRDLARQNAALPSGESRPLEG